VTRILALDVEALLQGAPSAEVPHGSQPLLWLVDAVRPHPDVLIVLLALRDRKGGSIEQLRLGELAGRVLGNTFNLPQQDALSAALRIDLQRAEHLVVAMESALVPDGDFNVLVCPGGIGLAPLEVRTSLERWLSSTRPVVLSASTGKSPRGQGERVLYLDFDGVLHHENVLWRSGRGVYAGPPGFTLFEHAALLEQLLAPFPLVRIVLSTSWVRVLGYSRSVERLPVGLQQRVIGATFHSEMDKELFAQTSRGWQVWQDVCRRHPKCWIALDDTDEGWPAQVRHHVLLTDSSLGIATPGMAQRITEALERMH